MMFRVLPRPAWRPFLAVPSSVNAQVLMQRELSARMALTIAETAWTECTARVSVAVVDRAGRLKSLCCGATEPRRTISSGRAQGLYGATFGAPRSSGRSAPRPDARPAQPAKVIPLQGGVPIKVGEETIVASVSAAPERRGGRGVRQGRHRQGGGSVK